MSSKLSCELKVDCLCGKKDKFLVYYRRPDRGREGAEYSGEIRCGVCAKEYRIIRQGNCLVLVRQKDIRQMINEEKKVKKYYSDLMSSPEVLKVLKALQDLIESKGDVSKRIKFLRSVKLIDQDEALFSVKNWINNNILLGDLYNIMKLVDIKDAVIFDKLNEYENLWKEVTKPLPKVDGWNCVIKDRIRGCVFGDIYFNDWLNDRR